MSQTYLKPRLEEIDIPPKQPFAHCALGREPYARILTDIVSVYGRTGCVPALEGQWGTGKTTFVKMWRQHLINNRYKTLYFNAWETDYTADPLVAMLTELKEIKGDESKYKKVVATSGRIFLSIGKGILRKITGINADEVADSVTDKMEEIGQDFLDDYANQKASFEDFKQKLREFVESSSDGHPIVFFIDEPDRCNPAYAVKVLERVKHLFDIPNIIFVLAVNKQQLCCAIQGYFGSARMDAAEYLRRFIDIEYTLPEPDMEKYCQILYDKYEFDQFFNTDVRLRYFGRNAEAGVFTETAYRILQHLRLNLREVDKIFAHTRLALAAFDANMYLLPDVFFLLCLWKVSDAAFYEKLRHHQLSVQELLNEFENRFAAIMAKRTDIYDPVRYVALDYTLATLLNCYNITDQGLLKEGELVDYDDDRKPRLRLPLNSKYISQTEMAQLLSDSRRREQCSYGLSHIFQRIDLLSPLRIN